MFHQGQSKEDFKNCPICSSPLQVQGAQLVCKSTKHDISLIFSFYTNGTIDSIYLCVDKSKNDYYAVHIFYGSNEVYIIHYIDFKKKGEIHIKDIANKFPIKRYTPEQLSTYILFS